MMYLSKNVSLNNWRLQKKKNINLKQFAVVASRCRLAKTSAKSDIPSCFRSAKKLPINASS